MDIKEIKRQDTSMGHPLVIFLNPGWLCFLGGWGGKWQLSLADLAVQTGI